MSRIKAYEILKEELSFNNESDYQITEQNVEGFGLMNVFFLTVGIQWIIVALTAICASKNASRCLASVCVLLQIVPCLIIFKGLSSA